MNIKNLIQTGANVQVVCDVNDLRELFLSFMEDLKATKETKKEDVKLTSADVKKQLGVNTTTLWRWARDKYLVPVKVGRKLYYWQSDIDKLTKKA